jgi:hypothetical protein
MVAQESSEDEALRLELQEAIVSFRHWTSQMTQAAGFIVTADVVLISYGFSQSWLVFSCWQVRFLSGFCWYTWW